MSTQPSDAARGDFWIFGYGFVTLLAIVTLEQNLTLFNRRSLIWKPIPDLDERPSYGTSPKRSS